MKAANVAIFVSPEASTCDVSRVEVEHFVPCDTIIEGQMSQAERVV